MEYNNKIHSGGSSKGNFGKPHKFKGPEKYQPKKSGEAYDMKQAYNKDLTEGARFNYLKNAIHDKNKK